MILEQEAMESFAFPDKVKMTKYFIPFYLHDPIILWEIAYYTAVLLLDCCKKPFLVSL